MRFNRGRIIRGVLTVICLLVMTGPPAAAVGLDFVYFTIYPAISLWDTTASFDGSNQRSALGVSNSPGGPLISLSSSPLAIGNVYYLYAGNLAGALPYLSPGALTTLEIYSNYNSGAEYYRSYSVVGDPGKFQLWSPLSSSTSGGLTATNIYLGWAQGTADKVDSNLFSPGGGNDIYLVLGIGVEPTLPSAVPIPSAMLLFGSGLAGLIGIGRWRMKKWQPRT